MLQIFQFKNLSKISWLGHGISTKNFGNVKIPQNRDNLFKTIGGLSEKDIVEANQVHGNHVAVVGKVEQGHVILDTDALITNEVNTPLLIKTADCVPILLVDPVKKAIGVVHAGWRGTVLEITRLAVSHMEDHFGTNPKDLVAGIGPSIGPCCYEVDQPIIDQFKYKFKPADKLFSQIHDGHANLDLWLANKFQLISAIGGPASGGDMGVKEKNIEISGICTYDNSDLFFSERKEKPTGRFGTVIWIKK